MPRGISHLVFFELDCSFTFCLSSILFQRIHEICSCTYFSMLCTSLIVVQFSMTERSYRSFFAPALRDSFDIISHQSHFVNTFFKVFSKLFWCRLRVAVDLVTSRRLVYYSISPLLLSIVSFSKSCRFIQSLSAFLYKFNKKWATAFLRNAVALSYDIRTTQSFTWGSVRN